MMDVISNRAEEFNKQHLKKHFSMQAYKSLMDSLKDELFKIDDILDRIKFINIVLERNNVVYENHKLVCPNPKRCDQNQGHENVNYDLVQMLKSLNVNLTDDAFSDKEKSETESKLDQILNDLKELKNGQEVIYEDLLKELEELKELFFLGKKTWRQLFIGKGIDMVASGIISETVSKKIIQSAEVLLPSLLEKIHTIEISG